MAAMWFDIGGFSQSQKLGNGLAGLVPVISMQELIVDYFKRLCGG